MVMQAAGSPCGPLSPPLPAYCIAVVPVAPSSSSFRPKEPYLTLQDPIQTPPQVCQHRSSQHLQKWALSLSPLYRWGRGVVGLLVASLLHGRANVLERSEEWLSRDS